MMVKSAFSHLQSDTGAQPTEETGGSSRRALLAASVAGVAAVFTQPGSVLRTRRTAPAPTADPEYRLLKRITTGFTWAALRRSVRKMQLVFLTPPQPSSSMKSLLPTALTLFALSPLASTQENVLLIIADDVGVDRVAAYGEHPDPGNTPNIDRLAQRGTLFRNAWAYTTCSPTRATILTGRYGFRTGIGKALRNWPGEFSLPLSEVLLPEALRNGSPHGYHNSIIGKWHLGGQDEGLDHPRDSGFDHHSGTIYQVGPGGFYAWDKVINGVAVGSNVYATTDTTDDALRTINHLPEPWLIVVTYNAAHAPYHVPPAHLHNFILLGEPDDDPINHHKAMVMAMDAEIGRLLGGMGQSVSQRTNVILIGDNGTQAEATQPPFLSEHAKGTPYEGGVNVPFIISGPRVTQPGSECDALVHSIDLFATIADMTDTDLSSVIPASTPIDSVSMPPYLANPGQPSIRNTVFSERFSPNGPAPQNFIFRTMRERRYKIVRRPQRDEFYDLESDEFEQTNLLRDPGTMTSAEQAAYLRLALHLDALLNS